MSKPLLLTALIALSLTTMTAVYAQQNTQDPKSHAITSHPLLNDPAAQRAYEEKMRSRDRVDRSFVVSNEPLLKDPEARKQYREEQKGRKIIDRSFSID